MTSGLLSWELENAVKLVDERRDGLYAYDSAAIKKLNDARPWKTDANYFKHIRISAVALLKMVMHARSGGSLEVMGLMQGYVTDQTFIVTDAFRLPVEGTETRVNAQSEAEEYMVTFSQLSRDSGQPDNVVGWYHSHPGYGCWLSGIDVQTEMTNQTFQDPFVAVVIDPDRTISAGKVEIGAFRTYPENHVTADASKGTDSEGFQTIPLAKMEDFGAYSDRYYPLDVSHFKSSLDTRLLEALWTKYWVGTLSASPLFTNRSYGTKQINELALKIDQLNASSKTQGRLPIAFLPSGRGDRLDKIVKAGNKIAAEEEAGLFAAALKGKIFGLAPAVLSDESKVAATTQS